MLDIQIVKILNITKLMMIDNSLTSNVDVGKVDILGGIFLIFILILCLLGNALVSYCGLTSGRTQAMNNLIVSLALAEMILALLVLPLNIYKHFTGNSKFLNSNICRILQYFQTATLGVINISLTIIAFERYLSIFLTDSKITLRKAKHLIVLSWSIPLFISSPIFLDITGDSVEFKQMLFQCNHQHLPNQSPKKWSKVFTILQTAFICVLPMCLLSATYFVMITRILRADASQKNLKLSHVLHVKKSPCGTLRENVPVAKRRALVMNFIVACLFLFCWTPIVTTHLVQVVQGHMNQSENSIYKLITYVALANLSLNPIVYGFFDSVFRSRVLCCLQQQKLGLHYKGKSTIPGRSFTEGTLDDLNVSRINVGNQSEISTDVEPLLLTNTTQSKKVKSLFSKEKLIKMVCNTRRYRSLGLSRSSHI